MTVTLYYLNFSRAIRVLWILEELNIPYNPKVYFRNRKTMLAPPSLAEVHPSGASPLIEDNGVVYAESGLILEYLVEKYGADSDLIWKTPEEKATIKYALYAAESNIMISGMSVGIHHIATQRMPYGLSYLFSLLLGKIDSFYAAPQLHKCLINLQSQIDKNGGYYCNGRLTVADIMYQGTLQQILNLGLIPDLKSAYPGLYAWNEQLKKGKGFQQSKQKEYELDHTDPSQSHSKL